MDPRLANGIRAQCQNKYGQTKKGAQIRGCCPFVRDQLFPLTFSQFGILTLEIGSSSTPLCSRAPVVTTIHSRASNRSAARRPFTLEEPMIWEEDHFRGGHLRTASRCPIIKPPGQPDDHYAKVVQNFLLVTPQICTSQRKRGGWRSRYF